MKNEMNFKNNCLMEIDFPKLLIRILTLILTQPKSDFIFTFIYERLKYFQRN